MTTKKKKKIGIGKEKSKKKIEEKCEMKSEGKISIDRKSIPRSYRDFLKLMQREGEFLAINDEVDWNLEMGAILRRGAETLSPSPIFNKVKDCPGFRAAEFGMQKSGTPGRPWARLAPFLGLPLDSHVMEMQHAYNDAMENGTVHPPKIVENKDAPCKENMWKGDEIDLEKIPSPLLHMGDGQRMIQTAGLNIAQTPDGKWTNWSTNRAAMIDKKTISGMWLPVQHNGMIFNMWKKKGKDMPVAIALGVPPACAVHAGSRVPDWVDEYDYASKMLDEPIEMVKCETNNLLVPAQSEIIVEGTLSITETCLEGPFGEWAGYLRPGVTPRPKMTVTAVTFRDNAILPIASPGVPPDSTNISISFFCCADYIRRLKEEGFPVIDGLQTFESAGHWFVIRVKNNWHELTGWRHNEFMDKLAHFIWNDHIGYGIGKIIVVGEDIDPSDPLAVTWAFASRNDPDPGKGFFQYPDIKTFGFGVDGYHSKEDFHGGNGGYGLYSCLGLEEVTGLPKPEILTFNRAWPKAVKEKVLANWDKWGFKTPDPKLMKHATPSTPWAYFATTGEGETGKGDNL